MLKSVLLGGLLGGLVLFMWLGLSWTVLPLHKAGLRELPALGAMASGLSGSAEQGAYYSGMPEPGDTGAQVAFMIFLPQGYTTPQPVIMVRGLIISILAALLVTFIVLAGRQQSYKARVGLSTCMGGVVALAGPVMFGNFFFFPTTFVIAEIVDQLVGWTLAGLVIAWAAAPKTSDREAAA